MQKNTQDIFIKYKKLYKLYFSLNRCLSILNNYKCIYLFMNFKLLLKYLFLYKMYYFKLF